MTVGYEVNKGILDMKVAQAAQELRHAFSMAESIAAWLANNPNSGTDPLISKFGYTEDEAYLIRAYFEGVETIRINNQSLAAMGRKLTGLEI